MSQVLCILCLSFLHGYIWSQLVWSESSPVFWVPCAQVCVCVLGELMRRDCYSFPLFSNPICSNKRLKGRESWDPAGQEGRDNNTYPWATFQHMQPFHAVWWLLFSNRKNHLDTDDFFWVEKIKKASDLDDTSFLSFLAVCINWSERESKHL